jgi:hypothetical protein
VAPSASAAQVRRLHDVAVPGAGPDRDLAVLDADVGQLGDPADVDQHLRLGEADLEDRQQRLAAGEQLGLVAVLAEQGHGVRGGVGAQVPEGRGNHEVAPSAAASTARTMLW